MNIHLNIDYSIIVFHFILFIIKKNSMSMCDVIKQIESEVGSDMLLFFTLFLYFNISQ